MVTEKEKETIELFLELQTMKDHGIGIWIEGHVSSPEAVTETMSVNEESVYMRDYIFQKGVLKEVHFDKVNHY